MAKTLLESTNAAKRIYEVKYEAQWNNGAEWAREKVNVLAGADAQAAVRKARRAASEVWEGEDDNGNVVPQVLTAFRLVEVTILAEAEL